MELGFELESFKTLHFTPEHRFRMYVMQGEEVLSDTVGTDTFDYNGALLPDAVVAATGREALHKFEPDLNGYAGTPAVLAKVDAADFSGMTLHLENNMILSQGELQTYYMLRVIVDGRRYPASLLTTKIKVHWQGFGNYCIYLDSLNSLLKENRVAV